MEFLFWFSALVLLYVYIGYPVVLSLLARQFPRRDGLTGQISPSVTLLVSAYNERSVIRAKVENSLALDYPAGLLEIVVVSDCSDDGTDEIVSSYAMRGVRLVRQSQRFGKTAGLNLGVAQSKGQIIVFSDANAMYEPDAVLQLTRHFSVPQVGYVVGNARYTKKADQAASADSEGLYWKLETWLKQKESEFGSVVGGDGAIYAIRRELFSPLLPTDINDFLNPLQIAARNYRGVYEPSAVCYEEAADSFEKEFQRKVRIISRSLNAIRREPRVVLPWVQPRHWFALVSHKMLRWFAPVFLLLSLATSSVLSVSPFYRLALLLQLLFYALAAVGWRLETSVKTSKLFYLPYYFCLVNGASLVGICRFLTGGLSPTWRTVRDVPPRTPDSKIHLASKDS